MNTSAFHERCLGRTEFACELLDEFIRSAPRRINELDHAITHNALSGFDAIAHSLAGVAGIFSAEALSECCRKLTAAVVSGDAEHAQRLARTLGSEIRRCQDFAILLRGSLASRLPG